MFAVFGKSKKKEYEKSFNKLGVKVQDEEKTLLKIRAAIKFQATFHPKR
jgi:hypothetical protein|nr:MAG TPA: hypothetical protein [Caudoviricetes sp.]